MFGFLNVDKPVGVTSRDVVNVVQKLIRPIKIGHTGTLDPLASGVLVLAVGAATRLSQFVLKHQKSYLGEFRLGQTSDTDDSEGTITSIQNAPIVSRTQLLESLERFRGEIQQMPPAYSALKINGERAYNLARRGDEVKLKSRSVTIHSLELVEFDFPNFTLDVTCSSGTYIRSLGRDIGNCVCSGAIMTALRRTCVGDFEASHSLPMGDISLQTIEDKLASPLCCLPPYPTAVLSPQQIERLLDGKMLKIDQTDLRHAPSVDSFERIIATDDGISLIAIMDLRESHYKPTLNFAKHWSGLNAER